MGGGYCHSEFSLFYYIILYYILGVGKGGGALSFLFYSNVFLYILLYSILSYSILAYSMLGVCGGGGCIVIPNLRNAIPL